MMEGSAQILGVVGGSWVEAAVYTVLSFHVRHEDSHRQRSAFRSSEKLFVSSWLVKEANSLRPRGLIGHILVHSLVLHLLFQFLVKFFCGFFPLLIILMRIGKLSEFELKYPLERCGNLCSALRSGRCRPSTCCHLVASTQQLLSVNIIKCELF